MVEVTIVNGIESPELISKKTLDIIGMAGDKSNNPEIKITSGIRSPYRQALAMYENERNGKHIRYAEPGKMVLEVFKEHRTEPKDVVVKMMKEKIEELSREGKRVSKHCVSIDEYRKMNIVDCSKHIPNPRDFVVALMENKDVVKVITPFSSPKYKDKRISVDTGEAAIHVEVRQ